MGRRLLLLPLVIATACADDGRPPSTVTPPTARDGGVAPRDGGTVAAAFEFTTAPNVTFDVDADGPDTQIHATVALVRDAVWVAYNRPSEDGTGNFDVFVTAFGGDGVARFGPTRVNETLGPNDIDPTVAVDGDRVLLAWQRDSQTAGNNLDVAYRMLGADGGFVSGEQILEPNRGGAPVDANVWQPIVAARPSGGFVLSAAWGNEAGTAFELFTLGIDRDGVAELEGRTVFAGNGNHQQSQTMTYGADRKLRIAWSEDEAMRARVYHTALEADGSPMPSPPPEAYGGAVSGGANITADTRGQVWLAMHVGRGGGADILLKPADEYGQTNQPLWVGEAGAVDQLPGLAFSEAGGLALWYRRISGFRNQLFVATLPTAPGEGFGTPIEIPTDVAAAPYGPAIVHATGDIYFVAWADGANPDYRVRARFVTAAR